ncbi:restriction endonuclease-like protein [Terrisporobacter muris]|uniref:Restriction endonuclease-like protein n=1 Tax=Terrisporobacter muris TaxID=2963284 RepID=A0A9X2MBQ1_9FIRM|nr:restriction endonuclease-like protein [Terrisporobacter muris]MCR1821181.1 restriction endonuclease-like protein [Terrisporobacter muris]
MMDMQATGIKKDILQISTSDFTVFIDGNSQNKKYNAINNNKNISGKIEVRTTLEDLKVLTLNSLNELEENISQEMMPSFFEDGIYNIYLENNNNDKFEVYHHSKEIRDNISYRGRNASGSFKFNGDIGYSTFVIRKNNEDVLTFTIQVFPTKLDYMNDYNEILDDINKEIESLVFDYLDKAFSRVNIVDVKKQTGVEFIAILHTIYENLDKSIRRIENHPKHGVFNEFNLKDRNKSKRIHVKETIKHLRKNKSQNVVEVKKKTTLDIYENQYVKYMIRRILKKVRETKDSIGSKYDKSHVSYEILSKYEHKLNNHLNGFFRDISDIKNTKSMTLVFKMASGYKEVYFYYNLLSKGLDIYEGLHEISSKKLWNLYEIWCYLKIHSIIKELGYTPKNSPLIQVNSNGLTLSVAQSKQSKFIYENCLGNKLELWYNKAYYGLPTTNQRPDTVLCLKGDKTKDRVYLFDAKYRIFIDNNGEIGPMEEDINVMHRYRDSIVSENKKEDYFKYSTFGAYVMFPCNDEKKFEENRFYQSIEKVNIGALPMLPGSTSLMKKHIAKIIGESYIEAVNNNPIFDEEGDYYKFKNSNVMIVNTKDKKHLNTYRKHRFYHIPKTSISKVKLGVEYLAFYQPQSKFGEESGIYYYAKVRESYTYERGSCIELECDKGKESHIYIRFELENFEKLSGVSTLQYGVRNVMYTTLYLLKNATNMHELSIKSRKEIEVYKILKRVSEKKSLNLEKYEDGYKLGEYYVKVYDNRDIRVNNELVDADDLEVFLGSGN